MNREQAALLAGIEAEERRRNSLKYEGSLHKFFSEFAWPIIEPRRAFQDNWHIHAICDHLEALSRRQIKRLLINVPFRTAKSTLVSVAYPAWVWAQDPEKNPYAGPGHQWLCGSYAEKLAIRDSLKMRRLVTHHEYQGAWGKRVQLASDQNQKVRFQNAENGYRIAFGMTGGVMGDGGDTLIIDDPHDRQGAHSELERQTALTTYDESLVTRLNDPESGAICIIMQRLHSKDLSGHVLEEGDWTHLMIPMEYEPARHCKTFLPPLRAAADKRLLFSDPRTTEGELMWAARFPRPTVDKLKRVLGDYGTAGQLQQRPAPQGGGILNTAKFQLWPSNLPLPDVEHILQSYDTAFTDQTANDPTACSVWGMFMRDDGELQRKCAILLDSWTEHMKYPALRTKVMADWKAEYGGRTDKKGNPDPMHPSRRADMVLIEEKGSGISIIQELQRANVPVRAYNPGRASKTARAQVASAVLDAEVLYLIESKRDPGKPVTWARPLVTQCEEFPNGEHDDMVDTLTQAVIYMQHSDILDASAVEDEEPKDIDYAEDKRKRRNPYGH